MRLLNRDAFKNVTFVNPPIQFDFPVEWWENPSYARSEMWVEKVLPNVIGYCYNGKKAPSYSILCIQKNGAVAFDITRTRFKTLQKYSRHNEERVKNGVSYRDAWNIDSWISEKCSIALRLLDKNTHSIPIDVEKLHKAVLEIDGKEFEPCDLPKNERDIKWYHEDLNRMADLFEQYCCDDDKCLLKNPYDWNLVWDGKNLEFRGTPEQQSQATKYEKRCEEIYQYRLDCLHKALKMLDVYIEELWD